MRRLDMMETEMELNPMAFPVMGAPKTTEAGAMLAIETAIQSLDLTAQRRVAEWIKARWLGERLQLDTSQLAPPHNGHQNGHTKTNGNGHPPPEPQYAIRGMPLIAMGSAWPYDEKARAQSERQGVLGGGIGGEDVEEMLNDIFESEQVGKEFEAGPNDKTNEIFRRLATDSDYRVRMRPSMWPNRCWGLVVDVLIWLDEPTRQQALEALSTVETYKAVRGVHDKESIREILEAAASGQFKYLDNDPEWHAHGVAAAPEQVVWPQPAGVLSVDKEVPQASEMLDETEWAASVLSRLCAPTNDVRLAAMKECLNKTVIARLSKAGVSTVAIAESMAFGERGHGVMSWLSQLVIPGICSLHSAMFDSDGNDLQMRTARLMRQKFREHQIEDLLSIVPYRYFEMWRYVAPPEPGLESEENDIEIAWHNELWAELRQQVREGEGVST